MKMTLSGDPREIAAFLQQFPSHQNGSVQLLDSTAMTPLPEITYQQEPAQEPAQISTEAGENTELSTITPVAEPAQEPAHETPIKDQIVGLLEKQGRATSREISLALGLPRPKVARQIITLEKAGVLFRDGNKARNNHYGLVGREHVRPEVDAIPVEVHNQYMALMGALEERENASVGDLRMLTNIPERTVQARLGEMIGRNWVKETTKNKTRGKRFIAQTVTRRTQAPAFTDFREAVLEDIRKHPGTTARSVSKRLLKSHNDVAARMVMLAKTGELRHEGENENRRWSIAS